jgi:hypothetical protein
MYKAYKALNPDLKNLDNQKLLEHYISYGFDEGRKCDENMAQEIEISKNAYQRTRKIQELARGYLSKYNHLRESDDTNGSSSNQSRSISKTIGTRISLDKNKDFQFAIDHTLYEPRTKCMATFIPKNGCTNLRYSFALANNLISTPEDIDWIHSNNQSMNANLENIQNSIYTFVVLRNPYERLASAFWNKFIEVEGDHYEKESSGQIFRDIFNAELDSASIDSFKDFINTLWINPSLMSRDTHLRHQTDFLLLSNYDDYFSLKQFQALQNTVLKQSGLAITDTRKITKHTTYGFSEATSGYYGNSKLKELSAIKAQNQIIRYEDLYDEEDSYKVTQLYLNDVASYIEKTDEFDSIRKYLQQALLHSTQYQI